MENDDGKNFDNSEPVAEVSKEGKYIELARKFNYDYGDWEREFRKRTKDRKEILDSKEFDEFEYQCGYCYGAALEALDKAEIYIHGKERYEILDSYTDIESYAGHFFRDREESLKEAIGREIDAEKREKAEKILRLTYYMIERHNSAMHNYELRSKNQEQYLIERGLAHNALIEHLNILNRLAEEYGTKRFTFRDFEPLPMGKEISEVRRDRLESDREAVENYFRNAYSGNRNFSKEKKVETEVCHAKVMEFHQWYDPSE